jgi:uncharacterized phage protein (TIGR01671 family)
MREIKFRQWDSVHKTMIDGAAIISDGHFRGFSLSNFSVNVPMQYTGLKDKNGKEIYEGDILGHVEYEKTQKPFRGEMKWIKDECRYSFFAPIEKFIIIGNIYENPELLNHKERK